MALAGARTISVAGERYRWLVAEDKPWRIFRADMIPSLAVVVQHASGSGQKLVAYLASYAPMGQRKRVVTPSFVAQLIRLALSEGWQPAAAGPELVVDAEARSVLMTLLQPE